MCTAFHRTSSDFCNSLAAFTHRICSNFIDPSGLAAFITCRLIPLDKKPGVRPIGICETVQRLEAGCEAATHAMNKIFDDETERILLVDAKNAFNSLNRAAALCNCQVLCPSLVPILINIYRSSAELFVADESILSQEGTTQGDP